MNPAFQELRPKFKQKKRKEKSTVPCFPVLQPKRVSDKKNYCFAHNSFSKSGNSNRSFKPKYHLKKESINSFIDHNTSQNSFQSKCLNIHLQT